MITPRPHRIAAALLALAACVTARADPFDDFTVNAALKSAESGSKADRDFVNAYAFGILAGMSAAGADLANRRSRERIFCAPPKLPMTPSQLLGILHNAVREAPKVGQLPFHYGLYIALQNTFPCDKK